MFFKKNKAEKEVLNTKTDTIDLTSISIKKNREEAKPKKKKSQNDKEKLTSNKKCVENKWYMRDKDNSGSGFIYNITTKTEISDYTLDINVKYFKSEDGHMVTPIFENPIGNWIDLRNLNEVKLHKGDIKNIRLGIGFQIPSGWEIQIRPRSSTAKKWGLLHASSGIIDESYCGNDDEVRFGAYATRNVVIPRDTRICQFRLIKRMPKLNIHTVEKFDSPNRGGFGSTGDN